MPEAIPPSASTSASASTPSSRPPPPPLPALTPIRSALLSCRFSAWYPAFRKVSPKATVLDVTSIQPDFFDWLEEDGLILPRGSGAGVVGGEEDDLQEDATRGGSNGDGDDEDDEDDDGSDDSASEASSDSAPPPPSSRDFSILDDKIRAIIEKYDGEVFPKLDWSAPRDAAWILPEQTLKCTTPADVYLLLKSSDFIAKDLTQLDEIKEGDARRGQGSGEDDGDDDEFNASGMASLTLDTSSTPSTSQGDAALATPTALNLIIKRHFNLNPSHEFRCFVRAGHFIAVTQRDATYYPFLQDANTQRDIQKRLLNFWHANLKGRFAVEDYVWDAYFTRDRSRVFLMDVNPYIPRTDALLWDWDELERKARRSWRRASGAVDGDDDDDGDDSDDDESDSDTGSSASPSSGEDSDDDDPRGEPFVRIYTDGRPPTTHYQPRPPPRQHRTLPSLRLLRSDAESSAAGGRGPTYATNMVPRDMIDVSNGKGVEEFARVWKEQTDKSVRA